MLRATDGAVDGEQDNSRNRPQLALHIYFYGPAEPIVLALPRARYSAAKAYYERVKSEVIEAQRHNEPRVAIRPFDRRRALLNLDPKTIQRIDLVDGLEPRPTLVVLTPPVPTTHEPGAQASTAAEAESADRARAKIEVASAGNGHSNMEGAAETRPDAGENLSAEQQRRIAILLG